MRSEPDASPRTGAGSPPMLRHDLGSHPPSSRWGWRSHAAFAVAVLLHVLVGGVAALFAFLTTLGGGERLAFDEDLVVRERRFGLALLLWLVTLVVLGVFWYRRRRLGLIVPFLWAAVGLPLFATSAAVETAPGPAACGLPGRLYADAPAPTVVWCHETAAAIETTVATSRLVYATLDDGRLLAVDRATGAERWSTDPGTADDAVLARDEVVFASGRTSIAAWTPAGDRIWSIPATETAIAFAHDDALTLYVSFGDGTVVALDAATGAERWRTETGVAAPSLFLLGGELLAVHAKGGVRVAVLDRAGGRELHRWTYDARPATVTSPATLAGGSLLVGTGTSAPNATWTEGAVVGLDARSGARRWQSPTGAPIEFAPAIAGETVLALDRVGQLYRLDLPSGRMLGSPSSAGTKGMGAWQDRPRLIALGGIVYVGQSHGRLVDDIAFRGTVTASDAATGPALWRFRTGTEAQRTVTVFDGSVYVPDGRSLFAIAPPPNEPAATPVQ